MDTQLCYSLTSLNTSALHFYKFVLQEKSNQNSSIASHFKIQNGHEIFETIEKQFEKLHNPDILLELLEVLNLTIQQTTHETCQLISKSIEHLLNKHSSNEQDYLIALHILKQFLTSLSKESEVEPRLIDEIIKPNDNIKVQNQQALCICLLVDKFQMIPLLEIAWQEILKKNSSNLMMNYIDFLVKKLHVFRKPEFWQLIDTFLLTDSNRKMAIFSIRKVLTFVSTTKETIHVDKYFLWPGKNLLSSWLTYLTILENLEEKQSHLILPALEMLQNVDLGKKTPWMRILLQQILRHKNNLVIRWSVNYLFRNFDKLIMENDILEDFFNATNNTWLYNEKLSFQQPVFKIKDGDYFMKIFAEIPWKSVPMHVWLIIMKQQQHVWKDVKCKPIISIATKIRQLQNRLIRSDCRELYFSIFNSQIEEMDLNDYMNFIDAFYSSSEKLNPKLLSLLISKIEESSNPYLSANVFSLLSKDQLSEDNQIMLIKKLETIPPSDHKWFSVLFVFFFDVEVQPDLYGITNCMLSSLHEATAKFVNKLSWDDVSKAVIRELTVDWFTAIKDNEIHVNDFQSFLHSGGIKTFLNLMDRVSSYSKIDADVFHAMISELKNLTKRTDDPAKL
ncbi:uncharacterized protein LOC129912548 [Episyrphus balteatus]|uniref:uncharacterized protein LOC129912548 n=1 Tax=Episyrphus balteatus TaxID=286459 RepID=UPI002486116D|nr:uncharacterized protein LOC129912548 [Episyrphus balteatus]